MNQRRVAALGALTLLTAGTVALVVTDDSEGPAPAAEPSTSTGPVAELDEPDTPASAASTDALSSDVSDAEAAPLRYDPDLVPELPDRGENLPLRGIDGWLQSDIESLDELRGKVIAVQFWTFGCFNCKNTMPHMAALYEKYGGDDFEIVGVHSPEFDHEKDPQRIAGAAAGQGVTWPIALDTDKQTFRSWQTGRRFWPRIYLIDRDGNVRYDKIGEGRYDEIDAAVGALIDEDE